MSSIKLKKIVFLTIPQRLAREGQGWCNLMAATGRWAWSGRAGIRVAPALSRWLALAVLCAASAGGAHAAMEARVRVDGNATLLRVVAEIKTNVDRATAWNVLTDYNRWSEFVPDLLVSRVISKPGEPVRLEQRARFPSLPDLPLVMIIAVEEVPPSLIRLRRTAGNVRNLVGEWHIQGKGPVRLVYRAVMEPGIPVPPELSMDIFRDEAKARLEAMAAEMTRRAGEKP